LLGLQAQRDAAKEVFPTMVTRGYYRTLGEASDWFLIFALQATRNSKKIVLQPQLAVVVVSRPQLARLKKPKKK
jgi:hypothetical protein